MVWLARLRCTVFWFRVLLSKVYMMGGYWEEWQWRHGKGNWMKNSKMINCCREIGWQKVGAEEVKNISEVELN